MVCTIPGEDQATRVIDETRDGSDGTSVMIPRLVFLIFLLVGLALGPVRGVASCGKMTGVTACEACCADPAAACCAGSCGAVPETPVVPTLPTVDDGKQLMTPAYVLVGFSRAPVVERPAVYRRQAARMPAVARLDLLCARLI